MEENRSINLRLPIYKVNMCDPWRSTDYVKAHFDGVLFIVDDGVSYFLCSRDSGGYFSELLIPREMVDSAVIDEVRGEMERYADVLEGINERLDVIGTLCADTNSEMCKQNRGFKALSERFDSIEDKFLDVSKGGEGVNILDVARSFAVIQKPELIKELNK